MIKLIHTLLFSILITAACAQDTIVKRNGEVIPAKIQEVGIIEIKYKKADSADGPVYTIQRSEIQMIKYADGRKEVFNEPYTPVENRAKTPKLFKSYLAFNIGLGIPTGKFASTDNSDGNSGFALAGVDFNGTFTVYISSHLGLTFKLGAHINSFDKEKFHPIKFYNGSWKESILYVDPISRTYYLIGPSIVIPGKKISYEIRALIGAAQGSYPDVKVNAVESTSGYSVDSEFRPSSSSAFTYNFGVGIRNAFSNFLSGMINLDFIGSNHEFNYTLLIYDNNPSGGYYSPSSGIIEKPISVFSITLGLAFVVGK